MKVLVTGASGLIGRHAVGLLLRAGHEVRTFQRGPLTWAGPGSTYQAAETLERGVSPRHGPTPGDRSSDIGRGGQTRQGPDAGAGGSDEARSGAWQGPATQTGERARESASAQTHRPTTEQADAGGLPLADRATTTGDSVSSDVPGLPTSLIAHERLEVVRGDIRTDLRALCAAAEGCRAVVHLAGRGDVGESRREPLGYARLNADGTLHALEAARAAGAIFVLASSQRVYGLQPQACREDDPLAPDSPYGYTKWVAELWCRMASEQFGLTTRVLRFFSVYGPGQQPNGGSGVVTIFARAALANEPLVVQSAGQRDFTDARDVARGILLAVRAPADRTHRVYNIATGVGTTFRALAEMLVATAGSSSPIEERIQEPAGRDLVADISRASIELGYTPCIPLHHGLEHYVQWLRRQNSA